MYAPHTDRTPASNAQQPPRPPPQSFMEYETPETKIPPLKQPTRTYSPEIRKKPKQKQPEVSELSMEELKLRQSLVRLEQLCKVQKDRIEELQGQAVELKHTVAKVHRKICSYMFSHPLRDQ